MSIYGKGSMQSGLSGRVRVSESGLGSNLIIEMDAGESLYAKQIIVGQAKAEEFRKMVNDACDRMSERLKNDAEALGAK